jgi:hypothetical protein
MSKDLYCIVIEDNGIFDVTENEDGFIFMTRNDKLFINIDVWTMKYDGRDHTSCTVNMVHERPDDEWCDLKIYSLTEDQVKNNLKSYEDKMVKLWEVFYK